MALGLTVMMIGVIRTGLWFLIVGVTKIESDTQHGVFVWKILRSKYLTGLKRVLMSY